MAESRSKASSTVHARRVALTGGIATGKSYVLARFAELGVPTIDADPLAREAVAPGSPGLAEVVRFFGERVLDASGGLDRGKLADVVFASPADRLALERIVHPTVIAAIDAWFPTLDGRYRYGLADIPLLFETSRQGEFDTVIVTACAPEEQVRRVTARDGLTKEAARRRLAAQLPIDEKVTRADFVIRTDGSFQDTDADVEAVHAALGRS